METTTERHRSLPEWTEHSPDAPRTVFEERPWKRPDSCIECTLQDGGPILVDRLALADEKTVGVELAELVWRSEAEDGGQPESFVTDAMYVTAVN